MITSQQAADELLQRWQSMRAMPPDERIEALMADFFMPPIATDLEYQVTLNCVSEAMACTP